MEIEVLLLGSRGVGKSCLLESKFIQTYTPTIGVDFIIMRRLKSILKVWDTTGDSRFRSLLEPYFKRADVIVICFSSRASFEKIRDWLDLCNRWTLKPVPIILLATKCDASPREVSAQEAITEASDLGMRYVECSSFNDTGRHRLWQTIEEVHVPPKPRVIPKPEIRPTWCCFQ